MFEGDSDYIVEQYIKPKRVAVPLINDERADILGNFEDDDDKHGKKKSKKVKEVVNISEENPFADDDDDDDADDGDIIEDVNASENEEQNGISEEGETEEGEDVDENFENDDEKMDEVVDENPSSDEITNVPPTKVTAKKQTKTKKQNVKTTEMKKQPIEKKTDLTDEQIKALVRGASKQDRFVLYVTNLNYSTTRDTLSEFFEAVGSVKSVRIPKVRRSAFAFVEMSDMTGFKNAFTLHNRTLDNYTIKVQISEGGKKKSANKKNILKQKNRKLAEMRNEGKAFQRSGKGYDKTIKKEINQRKIQQNRRLAKKQAKKQL
ncbi:nucleolin-like [Contarinia nasturtii]|uniref:nucleolin-like n=1 Tax=Contarinia nasturtii TaxID=265458 RepID=UPI0012D41E38|nr:nucleolin-like [Contarinia nasturtii]